MPRFHRYIGIDYSGAKTPTSSLSGLRVYLADRDTTPVEVLPPPSRRTYWTRRGVAEWLMDRLREPGAAIVGIDHGFSFPIDYFRVHELAFSWPRFLDDFHRHWPTDADDVSVDDVREGRCGHGAARTGSARWRRLTERRAGAAKSVFHFDVQGSVAKSTHTGLPWLRVLRRELRGHVHVWPCDGWTVPRARSVVAEVYPRLWSGRVPRGARTGDQHDAYTVASWLRAADADGSLDAAFRPRLSDEERAVARVEGWILGVE